VETHRHENQRKIRKDCIWVRGLAAPMHLGPLCPISDQGSPVALLKLQMAPRLILLIFSGSKKKKEPRCENHMKTKEEMDCGY
jgi:hypothetical protein